MIRYGLYILASALAMAFVYSWDAYRGYFYHMLYVLLAFMILLGLGEFFRPKGRSDNNHILAGGVVLAIFTFFGGHQIAYQKTVSEIAEWNRESIESPSTFDNNEITDLEVYNEYVQNLVNDTQATGIKAYIKYLAYIGFEERQYSVTYRQVTGFWVYFGWLFQIVMLGFGVYTIHYAIDPKYQKVKERRNEIQGKSKKKPRKKEDFQRNSDVVHRPISKQERLLRSLKEYISSAQTEWSLQSGGKISREEILESNTFKELIELGFTAVSVDDQERTLLNCLIHDRWDMHLVVQLLEEEKKRLKSEYVEVYGTQLHLFADTYKPAPSWGGLYIYFDERFPPKYSSAELKLLELKVVELVKLGADINKKNDRGITPFMMYSAK